MIAAGPAGAASTNAKTKSLYTFVPIFWKIFECREGKSDKHISAIFIYYI